jgi:type II secretory pathway pseudopilin PulG
MTLVEIMVAMGILAFMVAGTYSAFLTGRRLTEATIYKSAATATVQGYLEQIKNMDFALVPLSPVAGTSMTGTYATTVANQIQTELDDIPTYDILVLSPLPRLVASTLTPGTVPSAVYDNLKTFTVTRPNDLKIHIWVWVEDMTPASATATQQVKGLTIIYMTEMRDGNNVHTEIDSLRTFRSQVPTF